jgi:predicted amidophosphoribosyltransferase
MPPDGCPESEKAARRIPDEPAGRCPVCRTAFRRQRICPRCGADLYRLMWLAIRSWQRRTMNSSR